MRVKLYILVFLMTVFAAKMPLAQQGMIEYTDITLTEIEPDLARAELHLRIDNPLEREILLRRFSYDLSIADRLIFTDTYADELVLKPGGIGNLRLPVTVYRDSLQRVRESIGRPGGEVDSVTYTLTTRFHTDLPYVHREKIRLRLSFDGPLFRSPDVSVTDWDFEDLEDGNVIINLHVQIINYNLVKMQYENIDYQIRFGGDETVLGGSKPGEISIGKRDTGKISLPIRLDLGDIADAAWEYLIKGDDLGYRFEATLEQISSTDALQGNTLNIVADGKLGNLKKVAF